MILYIAVYITEILEKNIFNIKNILKIYIIFSFNVLFVEKWNLETKKISNTENCGLLIKDYFTYKINKKYKLYFSISRFWRFVEYMNIWLLLFIFDFLKNRNIKIFIIYFYGIYQ